jgi:hypothetical protein
MVAGCASSHRAKPSPAALRQACVERWNWMHYAHLHVNNRSVPATVRAKPCRIEIDYRLSRSDPLYASFLGTYFPCTLNRYLAYVCASNAYGVPDARPRTGQNARYFTRNGAIRLNRPPTRPVSVSKPDWVLRYPVTKGFIEPFDKNGKLRSGLTLSKPLRPPRGWPCQTFADTDRSTLIPCPAGLYCFVPVLPVRDRELIACPIDRGSRVFNRGRLRVLPSP